MNTGISRRQTTPISQDPFRGFFSQGIFDDLFDQYLSKNRGEIAPMMNVSMDVAETDQAFEVEIDLPGINPQDVDIQIDNNTLTIRGQRCEETKEGDEEKQFHRIERYRGSFARSIVLPNSINEEETAAEFRDGVLKIVVPKSDDVKPRKISISR